MGERPDIRERAEEIERASLSTWAALASESKGRDRFEDPDPIRTAFQQDRDRILHCDAFGRLGGKSDAFVPAEARAAHQGWRTRLSHTLAATQLARTLARGLRLNEDLAEAVTTGHALGAPPFGRAGVDGLSDVVGAPFSVGEQSLRVVERLSRRGRGLNLTWEVRDGILHHAHRGAASTLEGQVAASAVRFAELLHGLAAALQAGVVQLDDVPLRVRTGLGTDHGRRVATVVEDVVATSNDRPEIRASSEVVALLDELAEFLADAVDQRSAARAEADRAVHCLQSLAIYYHTNPDAMPAAGGDDVDAEIVDHLSGATDREVGEAFTATFRPSGWAEG